MASLGHLEVELLASILEYVDDEHSESTPSIALANKHIYSTSRLVSHRRQFLDFDELDDVDEIVTKWLVNPTALRGIRHITITTERTDLDAAAAIEDAEVWDALVTFIQKAARLRTITWKCRLHIPQAVLQALEQYHPNLQLKIYNYTRPSRTGDSEHPAELALAASPLLVEINAKIYSDHRDYRQDLREVALRRIIAKAPKLRHVSVLVDIADRAGHRAAEKQRRDPFYVGCSPNPAVRTLVLDGYRLSKTTLEDWSKFVDLSTVENIKCLRGGEPSPDYFGQALKVLPNLKHVSLNLRFNNSKPFRAAVENYLTLCPLLESLSLWSWMGRVKLETILRHSPTLQSLQLHEREEGMVGRPPMSLEHVRAIRERCQNLRDLTIDMRRESRNLTLEELNNEICAELALFGPQLDRIQIYFDLGIASIWSGMFSGSFGDEDSSSDDDDDDDPLGSEDEYTAQGYPQNILFEDDEDEEDEDDNTNGNNNGDGGGQAQVATTTNAAATPAETITIKIIKPSKSRHIERYVKEMWATIFGNRTTGPRILDVKMGEWEQKVGVGSGGPGNMRSLEMGLKSFWTAKPCVRDDKWQECEVERRSLVDSLRAGE